MNWKKYFPLNFPFVHFHTISSECCLISSWTNEPLRCPFNRTTKLDSKFDWFWLIALVADRISFWENKLSRTNRKFRCQTSFQLNQAMRRMRQLQKRMRRQRRRLRTMTMTEQKKRRIMLMKRVQSLWFPKATHRTRPIGMFVNCGANIGDNLRRLCQGCCCCSQSVPTTFSPSTNWMFSITVRYSIQTEFKVTTTKCILKIHHDLERVITLSMW